MIQYSRLKQWWWQMKKTICDVCGAETDGRNTDFSEKLINNNHYVDLCPAHAKEFDKVRAAALATYQATINAYLSCINVNKEEENNNGC